MKRLAQFDTFSIDVNKVFIDSDFNCRGYFTLESISDLAASIRELGLQTPVVVQPYAHEQYDYRLIAGYRRFAACTRLLGYTEVPGTIRTDLTEEQARILNLTENLERRDLNILEEAKAIRHTFPNGSVRAIAKALNRPGRWVHARQLLLRLPEEVQQIAAAGWLKQLSIVALSQLTSPEDQIEGARQILAAKQLNSRNQTNLPKKYRAKYEGRKTKEQITKIVARMLGEGVYGGMPRVAMWCAGKITDADLMADIKERISEQEQLQEDPHDD